MMNNFVEYFDFEGGFIGGIVKELVERVVVVEMVGVRWWRIVFDFGLGFVKVGW